MSIPEEWIRKLWYIYTMEYYSAIKKNTFESVLLYRVKSEGKITIQYINTYMLI